MDKSWIKCQRSSSAYVNGVNQFIAFGFANAAQGDEILCPCKECHNGEWLKRDKIFDHLIVKGFDPAYTRWTFHGESSSSTNCGGVAQDVTGSHDDMNRLLKDRYPFMAGHFGDDCHGGGERDVFWGDEEDNIGGNAQESNDIDGAKEFYRLWEDGQQELYPGCQKFTKLSFMIRFYLIKCLNGISNAAFDSILELLKESYPEGEVLPKNFKESNRMLRGLGFEYKKIDACRNNCMLFRNEHQEANFCHVCGACRWVILDDEVQHRDVRNIPRDDLNGLLPNGKRISKKVLRHFPLIPRLQRLFMCSKTASSMRWHEESRTKDGKLRHPADSEAWKVFNSLHQEFACEPRNVRLGLATDGFNPFGNMNVSYSIWPVMLVPYNLPPWMCMKSSYFMMSLLIPGEKSPGDNIDVYLQPLIEELKSLWYDGVETYDAASNRCFKMHAALMWTINDFPAYAMMSGWSTKGKLACPCCNYDTFSLYLRHSRKMCYMGHYRFLKNDHEWREDQEMAPTSLSGSDILRILEEIDHLLGITNKRKREKEHIPWTKKSIFFDLPYWKTNILRHNLDVMHIEKNVCDNVVATLLDISGKSKDHLNARLDLKNLGIREDLHPQEYGPNKFLLPPASFTLGPKEKDTFCNILKGVKICDGYASNISRCVQVKEQKIYGLKSHDCHFLLQYLLQLAVRRTLPKPVADTLIRLGSFFREICATTLDLENLDSLQNEIAEILCQLETIFPPCFFDVMVHLPVHLAEEAKLGGPVQYRWMYPVERYLHRLKSYVRNRSRPEGSIAEGYLQEECLTFCSRYLNESVDSRFNRATRNYDDSYSNHLNGSLFPIMGRPLGSKEGFMLNEDDWVRAHRYVLFNCDALYTYQEEHRQIMDSQRIRGRASKWARAHIHSQEFHEWFEERVRANQNVSEDIKWLSRGPDFVALRFRGFIINGYRFRTKQGDAGKKTQNSGVMVVASTPSFSSSKDQNPITGDVSYYGAVEDMIELNYHGHLKVVLFKCEWYEVKEDEFSLPLVNFGRTIYRNDPYVLASQVQQVFYVEDPFESNWHNAVKAIPRDSFNMGDEYSSEGAQGVSENG